MPMGPDEDDWRSAYLEAPGTSSVIITGLVTLLIVCQGGLVRVTPTTRTVISPVRSCYCVPRLSK